MTAIDLAVGFASDELQEPAALLATQLNLPLNNQVFPRLSLTAERLELVTDKFSPLFADFSSKVLQKRREEGKSQGVVRACKPAKGMRIIDATAGWGRDASILASFGAQVLMLERSQVVSALLADALARLEPDSTLAQSLSLRCVDSKQYLQNLAVEDYPDVIYIDPMHPVRQKSALVKKDMQILQQLLGADQDAKELLITARSRVHKRVIVKWPQRLAPLLPPNSSIDGKTVRFDIYLPVVP